MACPTQRPVGISIEHAAEVPHWRSCPRNIGIKVWRIHTAGPAWIKVLSAGNFSAINDNSVLDGLRVSRAILSPRGEMEFTYRGESFLIERVAFILHV